MNAWSAIAILMLVVGCGINLLSTARRVPPQPRAPSILPSNAVMRHEQRLACLRKFLHTLEVRGPIGYLADLPAAELAASHDGMEQYFLTQFALVPWVVDARSEDCEWVVANLHTTNIGERMPAGFRLAKDFGDGVWLLEKAPR